MCFTVKRCNEFTLKIRQILMHSHYVSTVSWSRRVTQLTRQLTFCFTKDGVSVIYHPISIMYSHVLLNLFICSVVGGYGVRFCYMSMAVLVANSQKKQLNLLKKHNTSHMAMLHPFWGHLFKRPVPF